MQTSYFQRYTGEHAVSIARITPAWYKCNTATEKPREYKKLAPPSWLLNEFKDKSSTFCINLQDLQSVGINTLLKIHI